MGYVPIVEQANRPSRDDPQCSHTVDAHLTCSVSGISWWLRPSPFYELMSRTPHFHTVDCRTPPQLQARKPSNISFAQAATIGVSFTTASITLRRGQVSPEDVVMILGATGSVGSAATQLAIARGCKVITASRKSTTDVNLVNDLTLTKALELTNGKGVDVVVDTTGDPEVLNAAIGILAHGGRLVFIAAPRSGSTGFTFDLKRLYRQEQMIIGCNSLSYSPAEMAIELQALQPLFENGQLSVMNEEELTIINLNDVHDALAALKSHSRSKYIIRFP